MRKYKIPYTLDTSMLDARAPLTLSKDGASSSNKEVTMRDIVIVGVGGIVGFWITRKPMFFGNGSALGTLIFIAGYILFLRTIFKGIQIPSALNFQRIATYVRNISTKIHKRDRIVTAVFGDYDNVAVITGFVEPDTHSNLLHFSNGDVGRVRRIIGSASYNIFESDRNNIINDYSVFLRTLNENVVYNFITVLANQRVYKQLHSLNNQKANEDNLTVIKEIDRDIKELLIISDKAYKSLHQYLVLRAPTLEDLTDAENLIDNFASTNNGAISTAFHEDLNHQIAIFKTIYGPSIDEENESLLEVLDNETDIETLVEEEL